MLRFTARMLYFDTWDRKSLQGLSAGLFLTSRRQGKGLLTAEYVI